MAIGDNNTTGRFLGQSYELSDVPVGGEAEPAALRALVGTGIRLMLTDLDADRLLALADAGRADGVTLFNIAAQDDRLRQQECRANVIHVAPTRRMLADALAQYLVTRRWSRWLLVYGSHPGDALLADAYRGSAKRFGARIVEERLFEDTGGARQSDSGIVQVQQQIPVFTQRAPEYDVLVAADENEVFAEHLPYRTWDPRPVAGSAGLRPVTWDASSESWGGAQMQNRFPHGVSPPHEPARHAGLDGRPHDRRGGQPGALRRSGRDHGGDAPAGFRRRRLQGAAAQPAPMGLAAPPADPAQRRPHDRLGVAAAGLPAPERQPRHAGHRSAGEPMQTAMIGCACCWPLLAAAAPARADVAYVSNEADNTIALSISRR